MSSHVTIASVRERSVRFALASILAFSVGLSILPQEARGQDCPDLDEAESCLDWIDQWGNQAWTHYLDGMCIRQVFRGAGTVGHAEEIVCYPCAPCWDEGWGEPVNCISGDENLAGDCDGDDVSDLCDLFMDPTQDCDENGIIDKCEMEPEQDCNGDGKMDLCQLPDNDCNGNGTLDECDTDPESPQPPSPDCNKNTIPDECETADPNDPNSCVTPGLKGVEEPQPNTECYLRVTVTHCKDVSWTVSDPNEFPAEDPAADCEIIELSNPQPTHHSAAVTCLDPGWVTVYAHAPGGCKLPIDVYVDFEDCDRDGKEDACEGGASGGVPGSEDRNCNAIPDSCEEDINGHVAPTAEVEPPSAGNCCFTVHACHEDGVNVTATPGCTVTKTADPIQDGVWHATICDCPPGPIDIQVSDPNEPGASTHFQRTWVDCNGNGLPDSCEVGDPNADCNVNGVPDVCEDDPNDPDCNGNQNPDVCDILDDPNEVDCNHDGVLDICQNPLCLPPFLRVSEFDAETCCYYVEVHYSYACNGDPPLVYVDNEAIDPVGPCSHNPNDVFCQRYAVCGHSNAVTVSAARNDDAGCRSEVELEFPTCLAPQNVTVEGPDEWGEYTLSANHCAGVDWKLVRNEAGCPEPVPSGSEGTRYTAKIKPCESDGWVTVRISDLRDDDCYVDKRFRVKGCGSCAGGQCGDGGGSVDVGSVDVYIDLGRDSDGRAVGGLAIRSDQMDASLYTPAPLEFPIWNPGVSVDLDANGAISQIIARGMSVQVATLTPWSYEVRLDRTTGIWGGLRYRRWRISDPDAGQGSGNRLEVVERESTNEMSIKTVNKWIYEFVPATGHWLLHRYDPGTNQVVQTDEVWWVGDQERRVVRRDGGEVERVYRTFDADHDQVLVEQIDPLGDNLTTERTYYSSGQLKSVQRHDRTWNFYVYDSMGRRSDTYEGWLDAPFSDPPDSENSVRTHVEYDPNFPDLPVLEQLFINDVKVRETTFAIQTVGFDTLEITETRVDLGAGPDVVTVSRYQRASFDEEPIVPKRFERRPTETLTPDGLERVYEYETVYFTDADPSADWNNPTQLGGLVTQTFDPNNPSYEQGLRVIIEEEPDGGLVPGKCVRTETIMDASGRPVLRVSKAWINGGAGNGWEWFEWERRTYDAAGRPLDVVRSDYRDSYLRYGGCCAPDQRFDTVNGVEFHEHDILGRTVSRIDEGYSGPDYPAIPTLKTEFDYEVVGNRLRTTTTVSGGSLSLLSFVEADLAGRVRTEVDAADLTTTTSYDDVDGHRAVTVTRPNGATEITTYYNDGRVRSVTGTGVIPRFYTYSVNTDGTQVTEVREASTSSPRFTRTVTDTLGRTLRTERPAFDSTDPIVTLNHYDDAGRLERSETSHDGARVAPGTVNEYDDLGAIFRTGQDLNDDGDLTTNTADRITEIDVVYTLSDGEVSRVSERRTLKRDGSVAVTTESRELLRPLAPGTISEVVETNEYGLKTRTRQELTEYWSEIVQTQEFEETALEARQASWGGLVQETTSRDQLTTTYSYDALRRQVSVTDSRGNTQQTAYNALGQVEKVIAEHDDPEHPSATYDYEEATGELRSVTNADGKAQYFAYDLRGQVEHVWGDVPQPITITYDAYGQRETLTTYRTAPSGGWNGASWPTSAPSGDVTTWVYDEATGLLIEKIDAAGQSTNYTYTPDGRPKTRLWARLVPGTSNRVTTTYDYDPNSAELASITYNDDTPPVTYDRNHFGQLSSAIDATGTRTLEYDAQLKPIREIYASGSIYGATRLTYSHRDSFEYQTGGDGFHFQGGSGGPIPLDVTGRAERLLKLAYGVSGDIDKYYVADYDYDAGTARMSTVSGTGLPSSGVTLNYLADSALLERLDFKTGSTVVGTVTKGYFSDRDALLSVINKWNAISATVPVSKYTYALDPLSRRTSVLYEGSAFGGSGNESFDLWRYNARHELTGADRYDGSDPESHDPGDLRADHARDYVYDPIGNRDTASSGDPQPGGTNFDYATNNLNQYWRINALGTQGLMYDADGNLTRMYAAADTDADGDVDLDDLLAIYGAWEECENDGGYVPAADVDGSGCIDLTDQLVVLGAFGQPSGAVRLEWDAENRLIRYAAMLPIAGDKKVEYDYDYLGRRVERRVYDWDPNAASGAGAWKSVAAESQRWVYYQWQPLVELDAKATDAGGGASAGNVVVRRAYTWGPDLSGSATGAGGIGGLLASQDLVAPADPNDDRSFIHFYDGNGNTGQLVEWRGPAAGWDGLGGVQAARYEYDAYGNVLNDVANAMQSGDYAEKNAWRFSTKTFDPVSGLGYWGYRWYSPRMGRWCSRDPIEESDDAMLYRYVKNTCANASDTLGMATCGSGSGCCGVDITRQLFQILAAYQRMFYSLSDVQQCNVCFGAWHKTAGSPLSREGWDISQLHLAGVRDERSGLERQGCGTGACAGTVTVDGSCHRANEVNYILWGKLNRLCDEATRRWPGETTFVTAAHFGGTSFKETPCGFNLMIGEGFALRGAEDAVTIWRATGGQLTRGSASPAGAGSTECRRAWTRAGWFSLNEVPTGCACTNCGLGCGPYMGILSGDVAGYYFDSTGYWNVPSD